jgi:glycosyltransferase involved in cell wall biosynthesis
MSSAKTSVIMPVRNGERYVAEALDSVLPQLGADDEVLVVDDGSTDGTRGVLAHYEPRIRALSSGGRGPSAARNVGLAAASGDYIAFLDHDDMWPPPRHAALLHALSEQPAADAAVGRVHILVEENADGSGYLVLEGQYKPALLMTCLFRRALIDKVGLFDESMRFGEDLDYYLRQTEAGMKVIHCDIDALIYRRHHDNSTNAAPARTSILVDMLARRVARKRKSAAGNTSVSS